MQKKYIIEVFRCWKHEGKYRWRVRHVNNHIILTSEPHENKSNAVLTSMRFFKNFSEGVSDYKILE